MDDCQWLVKPGHVRATAHRGLDHAVAIGALRYLDFVAVIGGNAVVGQFLVATATGHRADGHAASFTFVDCHD